MSLVAPRWEMSATVTHVDLQGLFPYLVRVDAVYLAAEERLTPQLFDLQNEQHFALVWSSTAALRRRYRRAPFLQEIEHHAVNAASLDGVDTEAVEKLLSFIYRADVPLADLRNTAEYGLDLLKKFMVERKVGVAVREHLQSTNFEVIPADLPSFLAHHAQEAERLSGLNQLRGISAYAEDMFQRTETVFNTTSTGFRFLDEAMSGGTTSAEINAIVAPTDGGKTLAAVCLGKGHAVQQRLRHLAGEPHGLTVYFTYETDSQDLRLRFVSSVASISMQSLMAVHSEDDLSRAPNYKPYEISRFRLQIAEARRQGQQFPGEYERLQMHKDLLGTYFWICDMRGDGREGNQQGRGYLGEMASILDRVSQERQVPISMVLIDYAGLACERYMEARKEKIDNKTAHLSRFGDHCRTMLVDRFGCAVWALQQASGEANTKSPATALKHTDTRDSKTFCDNMNYAVCLGMPDPRSRVQVMYLSKSKRRPATAPNECFVILDSDIMSIRDVREEYVRDPRTGQIISAQAHAERIQGTTGSAGGPAAGGRNTNVQRRIVRD